MASQKAFRQRLQRSPTWLPHAVLVVIVVAALATAALLILYQIRGLIYMLFLATFVAILIRPRAAQPMLLVVAVVSVWAIVDYTWMLHKARAR